MDAASGMWVGIAAVLALAVLTLIVALVTRHRRAVREQEELRIELDRVRVELDRARAEQISGREPVEAARSSEFVITGAGRSGADSAAVRPWRSEPALSGGDQLVLSATLGEPLVKIVSFGHGLRRALSPASRNRIGFEMRRESRRARKTRRKEMREAWRRSRTGPLHPTGEDA